MAEGSGDTEAAKALVAFLKAVGVTIAGLDTFAPNRIGTDDFLAVLDELLGEAPSLLEGAEAQKHVMTLRAMLGENVAGARETDDAMQALKADFDEGSS